MKRKAAKFKPRRVSARKRTITLSVDATIFTEASAILAARGTDLKRYLTLQITAFTKVGKPVVGLKDKMPLGKYFGAVVEDVVRGDPTYAKWMLSNEGPCDKFLAEVHELYQELTQ